MYSNQVLSKNPKTHLTYRTISKRLADTGISLESYVGDDLKVWESTLDGISFESKIALGPLVINDISTKLATVTTPNGKQAFRQGNLDHKAHFALDMSMAATKGIGFREIIYLDLPQKSRIGALDSNPSFQDNFSQRVPSFNISSLHCAVNGEFCSIHIDETGFVFGPIPGLSGDVIVGPEAWRHTIIELIYKDKLPAPDWLEIVIPDHYSSRLGLDYSVVNTDNLKVNIRGTCKASNLYDCSATINVSGKHDLLGG